ncbi:hypothetical protein [Nocardia sienata]|uniref:hypothetical protein n=1 Tax=Nocardia sienata TaxID=248552 RepID=UPI000A6E3128|nr:hypothetical protein [Nocardia sienata]
MTDYYVYSKDGFEKQDHPPKTGFYYTQGDDGVVLYEADPWGDAAPRKHGSWDGPDDLDSIVTADGEAYGVDADHHGFLWLDVTYKIDKDDRKKGDDPKSLLDTFGPDYKPKDSDNLIKDDGTFVELTTKDGKYDNSWLRIETPVGTGGVKPSRYLVLAIERANRELNYLTHQIGTGDINKPKFLQDPKGDKKILDDGLDDEFIKRLHDAAGKSYEAEGTLKAELVTMKEAWMDVDKSFGTDVLVIDDYNHTTFKGMVDKISAANEAIARSLIGVNDELEKPIDDADDDLDLSQVGIQHLVEEAPLFRIIADGVEGCAKLVDEYADKMQKLAEKDADRYGHLVDDKKWHRGNDPESEKPPEKKDPKKKKEEEDPGDKTTPPPTTTTPPPTTTTPPPTTTTPPPTTTTPPPTTTTPPATPVNADDALKDLNKQYDQILGDSTKKPTDGTETPGTDGEKSPSGVTGQPVAGNQSSGGATQAQPAVQPAVQPAASGSPDMSSLAMLPLLSQMANGGNQPGNDGGDKDDKDKGKDDPRGRGREVPAPGQASPGVAPGPTDQGPGVQPAVTAPTDTGTPPVVMTPGASVDYKPYEGYKAPDGKGTVPVPQAAAEALTRQAGNSALNAFTAYEGTQASQDMGGTWKTAEGELRTGDVVRWENHSAVVFNDGSGPQYWKDGQLVRLEQNGDLDNLGHGKFVGFLRPQGLGEADAQQPAAPPGLPKPEVTMSTPQAPPSVQAPQEPKAI